MPAIGFVTKKDDGSYTGRLQTLAVNVPISITPNANKQEGSRQPDFLVKAGRVELGAAWVRTSLQGDEYVSVSIAAPEFGPRRLYANLVPARDAGTAADYDLLWNPAD